MDKFERQEARREAFWNNEPLEERARKAQKSQNDERQQIEIKGGELPAIVDAAEDALLESSEGVYQRGATLVRTVRLSASTVNEISRKEGALSIVAVDVDHLTELLTRIACFVKRDKRSKSLFFVNCPKDVAKTYLARVGRWKVPPLTGIIEAPTLRPDGSIFDKPGYDSRTGLVFDPGNQKFPVIPVNPTYEHVKAALQVLLEPIEGFSFENDHDKAVAVSAILTALVRRSLRSAPLHAFSAPIMASGKSLLADVVGMIATGRPCAAWTYSNNPEEEKKRLFSALLAGDPVLCIDNVEGPLHGDALCSVLTQSSYNDRLLGVSKTATVSTATTILATGNNLEIRGDLSTRVMLCSLDPKTEKPESRRFDVDLHDYIPKHRGELVQAALTILRAYHVAGRPDQGVDPFGRFEEWSKWIRCALIWVGMADPCESRQSIETFDPVRSNLGNLLSAWNQVFGKEQVTVKQIIREASRTLTDKNGDVDFVNSDLHDAVSAVAEVRGAISPRALGKFLNKHRNRIEGGYRVQAGDKKQNSTQWLVSLVSLVCPNATRESVVQKIDDSYIEVRETNSPNSPNSQDDVEVF